MSKKRMRMEVLGTYAPNEVLPLITREMTRRNYAGDDGRVWSVRMNSHRYWTFRKSGLSCVVCGLAGSVMSLERTAGSRGRPHFNLYALSGEKHILMTKDHIEPKSEGGPDAPRNFQTMCTVCNGLKSNHRLTLEQVKRLRNAYDALVDTETVKGLRQILSRLAARMASGEAEPMTARDLAALLMKTPDALVAVFGRVGHEAAHGVMPARRGALDAGTLPDEFIVIKGGKA